MRPGGEGDQRDAVAAVLLERVREMAQRIDGPFAPARLLGGHAAAQIEDQDDITSLAILGVLVEPPLRPGTRQRDKDEPEQTRERSLSIGLARASRIRIALRGYGHGCRDGQSSVGGGK